MSTETMFEKTIKRAAEIAYNEDATQVIGRIDGRWEISGSGDMGRLAQMARPTFFVSADGLDETASSIMSAMEMAGIEGDQDWENESTTYTIDEDRIVVSGSSFEINP